MNTPKMSVNEFFVAMFADTTPREGISFLQVYSRLLPATSLYNRSSQHVGLPLQLPTPKGN